MSDTVAVFYFYKRLFVRVYSQQKIAKETVMDDFDQWEYYTVLPSIESEKLSLVGAKR